ncbi:MAG: FTR1 family protein [Caldilineaceae bacterium]
MKLRQFLLPVMIICLILLPVQSVWAQTVEVPEALQTLRDYAQEGMTAAAANDAVQMKEAYTESHELWEGIEDNVRDQDPAAYVELEAAFDGVKSALQLTPLDATGVEQAFDHLFDEAAEIAERFEHGGAVAPAAGATVDQSLTPDRFLTVLTEATDALAEGNQVKAKAELNEAIAMWPTIEGAVAVKSQNAYSTVERNLGHASAALRAEPADVAAATAAIGEIHTVMAPFVTTQTYGMFDAAAIILREGLEALLIVVALLAFLRQVNSADKGKWIWAGAGAGILASVAVAFVLQAFFNQIAAGQNRELIEGITGLLAAALLFYVSYWLHSKTNLHAWQRYINTHTSRALASGSVFGLMALSFLSVFREGAETTIFYLGMAPSIATRDLLLGLGLGSAVLVVAAVAMLFAGVRLPLKWFFQIAGLLVYYLGFKFVGAGIHALQVAGWIPASPIALLQELPSLGVYPTWETLIPQFLLLAAAVAVVLYLRKAERTQSAATAVAG